MNQNLGLETVENVWKDQALWSAVANRLKEIIAQARLIALCLGILAACLATLSSVRPRANVDNSPPSDDFTIWDCCSFASAAALVGAGLYGRRFSPGQIENWNRARSASEAIKQEVFLFLAHAKPYACDDRLSLLSCRVTKIVEKVNDLIVVAATIHPKAKPIPDVSTPLSYIENRIKQQIDHFYFRKALHLGKRLKLRRDVATALAIIATLLCTTSGFLHDKKIDAWVAVVTTMAGAVLAYAAGSRYEQNITNYFCTARKLKSLCSEFLDAQKQKSDQKPAFDQFVRQCEEVISIESQAWMADWHHSTIKSSPQPQNAT
jgi:hypothetical protein